MTMDEVIEFLNLEKVADDLGPNYYKFEDISPEYWASTLLESSIDAHWLWRYQSDGSITKYVEFNPPDSLRLKFTNNWNGILWSISIVYINPDYKGRSELEWIAWKKAIEEKFGDTAERIEEYEKNITVRFIDHDIKNDYIKSYKDLVLESAF